MLTNHNIVQFKITMGKTHAVQVGDARQNLHETARDLLARHFAGHDSVEKIVWCVFHHLVPATALLDDVKSFDNVSMMKR